MSKQIKLSQQSIDFILQGQNMTESHLFGPSEVNKEQMIKRKDLIIWLGKQIKTSPQSKFCLASLRASLLQDLHASFLTDEAEESPVEVRSESWFKKIRFGFLAAAGTLLAFTDGFTGMVSLASGLLPAGIALGLGYGFAALSVGVYYGFDLAVISENMGVDISGSRNLLDVLQEQADWINKLRKEIKRTARNSSDIAELNELQEMKTMLQARHKEIDAATATYQQALNRPALSFARKVTALLTGAMFFSSGFFMGQSLAALLLVGVSAAAWPVTLMGVVMGIAAFGNYWFLERPGLEDLVSTWCGLDREKIEQLSDDCEKVGSKLEALSDLLQDKVEGIQSEQKTARRAPVLSATQRVAAVDITPEPARLRDHTQARPSVQGMFRRRANSTGDLQRCDASAYFEDGASLTAVAP